jgi:hypothetical protein
MLEQCMSTARAICGTKYESRNYDHTEDECVWHHTDLCWVANLTADKGNIYVYI